MVDHSSREQLEKCGCNAQAEFPAGSGSIARLYIGHGMGTTTLKPMRDAQISAAEWKPLSDLLDLPDDSSPQEHPVFPFLQDLKALIQRCKARLRQNMILIIAENLYCFGPRGLSLLLENGDVDRLCRGAQAT